MSARGLENPFPLTAPQEVIWLDQALHPNKPIYNTGQVLSIQSEIDLPKLETALNRVVIENDALRLKFVQRNAKALQTVVEDVPVLLDVQDFSKESDPEVSADAWLKRMFWQAVAPADFPLFKFALAKLSDRRFLWLQRYHHLIIDATGRQLVATRAAAVYDAICAGIEPAKAEMDSYRSAKAAEDVYLSSQMYALDEAYWTDRLKNPPPSMVGTPVKLSEKLRSGQSAQIDCKLTNSESTALRRFARDQGTSVFKIILTAAWCCLSRLYGLNDIIFAVPLSGRTKETAVKTAGLLARVMPFRLSLDPAMLLRAGIAEVDKLLSEDLKHQNFPAHHVNKALRLHAINRASLYDAGLNYVRPNYGFTFGGKTVACSTISTGFSLPWSVSASDAGADEAIQLLLKFDPGRVGQDVASRLAKCLRKLLLSIDYLIDRKIADAALDLDPLPLAAEAHDGSARAGIAIDKKNATSSVPSDPVEAQILEIWRRRLNTPHLGVDDNYFASGGDSLRAVLLLAECNEQLGTNLPLSVLFEGPTVAAVASAARADTPRVPSPRLVRMKSGENTAPLLLVHPIGGSIFCYTDLVANLGISSPVYGIESSGLQGDEQLPGSIEEIAQSYLNLAGDVIGEWSIHLAGWSFGGLIAVEMARQLMIMQRAAASITIIDTTALRTTIVDGDKNAILRLAAAALGASLGNGHVIPQQSVDQIERLVLNARHLRQKYKPDRMPISLTLVRAALEPGVRDEDFDWSSFVAGKIETVALQATHDSVIRPPHVVSVAAIIERNMR
jgi:thioesterase domain-containing protein